MLSDFRAKIQTYLDRGESVQVIAPYGFGKSRFGKSLGGLFIDPHIDFDIMAKIQSSAERKLIVLDSFDEIPANLQLFNFLKGLRDRHKYQLSYVFLTHKLLNQPILGDLLKLISEHIEYLPPLEPSEYDLFGFSPTPKQLIEIEALSAGIPILVKHCALAMRDGKNPTTPAFLPEMLAESPTHPAYANSSLIQDFLKNQTVLSASETRLLDLLKSRSGQIVSKDQICEVVYPDVKNKAGISDHAIDQLIHRLRSKIKDQGSIVTRRGLGFKLVPSP